MRVLGYFQKLGKALMLPIAVLPVAGLLMRFGQPDLLDIAFIAQGGQAIFDNLPLLFAMGVAAGLSKDSSAASAVSAVVGYFVMSAALNVLNTDIDTGAAGGYKFFPEGSEIEVVVDYFGLVVCDLGIGIEESDNQPGLRARMMFECSV